MTRAQTIHCTLFVAMLGLSSCGGLYFGDNPTPDVRKETGPLTIPPPGVRAGTDP